MVWQVSWGFAEEGTPFATDMEDADHDHAFVVSGEDDKMGS
jgi:hypothetical protein